MTRSDFLAHSDREQCKLMVKMLAERMERSEPRIWGLAYWKVGQKAGLDVKEKAAAAGISALDWIQDQRRMPHLKRAIKEIHDEWKNPRPRRKSRR
jgi:hypothetical protein